MKVIEYLSQFGNNVERGLESLEKDLGIKSKIYDNFFILTYNQIESPKTHPIVLECRGLILDWNLNVLRSPFDRFFNYGEANTQDFDFQNAVCLEKCDGSLVPAWWNPFEKKWCFGTKGTAFAECQCGSGRVFEEIINDCFTRDSKESIGNLLFSKNFTYIFELCSPENRVVVPYNDTSLVLLGIRSNVTGMYADLRQMDECVKELQTMGVNTRLVKYYGLDNLDDIKRTFDDSGISLEGYVFWNTETDERVKVKSPQYVAIHHLRDNGNLNPKRICELVFANETDEYLNYFKEDQKYFDPWINAYEVMVETIHFKFEIISSEELTQKEYALKVKDLPYAGIMFALRQGKSLQECFEKMNSDAKVRLLECFKE